MTSTKPYKQYAGSELDQNAKSFTDLAAELSAVQVIKPCLPITDCLFYCCERKYNLNKNALFNWRQMFSSTSQWLC